MKRKLLTIILMVTISITSLTACGHKDKAKDNQKYEEEMIADTFIIEENLSNLCVYPMKLFIVHDKNTKVKYLFFISSYASDITPLYNADGTLQIHED